MPRDNRCNICNSDGFRIYLRLKDKFVDIVKCKACNTLRAMPYPKIDYTDKKIYCEHYLDNEPVFRMFADSVINIIARHKKQGRLLDIGCSVGFMLEAASKLGFDAEGLELNKKAVDIALSKKLNVRMCGIEEAGYIKKSLDIIILNHILEHIFNPVEFIQRIAGILKDDGLLIIGVPNHGSLVTHVIKRRWYGWGIPEHVWHFDRISLEYLLSKSGLRIKELIQNSQHYASSKSFKKNLIKSIAWLGNKIGKGDQLILVSEKA